MAKELTKEEKKIKSKSTGQVLEDFYISKVDKKGKNQEQIKSAALDLYLKSITDKDDAANAEMKRLQDEANAKDAAFNANIAAQREQTVAQLTPRESSKRKPPANYLSQEQVQAQNAIDEKQSKMVPIKEPEYTSAGKVGKGIREGIKSAIGYTGDVLEEYVNQPIENLPKYVGNTSNAIMEGIGGLAGQPVKLGRQEYTDIRTRFDKKEPYPAEAPEKPQPLSEQEPTPETAPAPKEALKNVYAVSLLGREDKNKTFNSLKEAQDYFKAQGGKGAIATFKNRRTDKKSVEALQEEYRKKYHPEKKQWRPEVLAEEAKQIEEDKRSGRYSNPQARAEEFANAKLSERMAKKEKDIETQALKKSLTEKGKEIASKAKETRLAEDKVNQGRYKKFKEDVALNAEAETAYNKYNTNQSLLKKAYNEAVKNKDYGAAFNIERISEMESAGVPFEQGARREYFKKQMPTIKKQAIERET